MDKIIDSDSLLNYEEVVANPVLVLGYILFTIRINWSMNDVNCTV